MAVAPPAHCGALRQLFGAGYRSPMRCNDTYTAGRWPVIYSAQPRYNRGRRCHCRDRHGKLYRHWVAAFTQPIWPVPPQVPALPACFSVWPSSGGIRQGQLPAGLTHRMPPCRVVSAPDVWWLMPVALFRPLPKAATASAPHRTPAGSTFAFSRSSALLSLSAPPLGKLQPVADDAAAAPPTAVTRNGVAPCPPLLLGTGRPQRNAAPPTPL
jgi:hypothetical protein